MKKHTWNEVLNPDETMYYEATHHAGSWKLRTSLKSDEDCIYHDEFTKENLLKLREILWNKYQRGRGSHAIIAKLDKQIAKLD